jgi:L-arabinose isomerase
VAEGLDNDEIAKASRLGVALQRLVKRFRLDGLSLLGQHHVERIIGVEPFLGMNELNRMGFPTTSEGDVIGLIMMKILHHLTGNMAFHLEWCEFISEHNCLMMLGHGFGDPNQARNGIARLTPAAEPWDVEGTGISSLFSPKPGLCTMAHFIEDADGWRMNITTGEILDIEPMPINEIHAFVKMALPIREFIEKLIRTGVAHHGITVRGNVRNELQQLADLMEIPAIII